MYKNCTGSKRNRARGQATETSVHFLHISNGLKRNSATCAKNAQVRIGGADSAMEGAPREEEKYDLIAFTDKGLSLDVRVDPDEDTVWLTKDQMALLFDRDRSAISRHIKSIYKEGELSKKKNLCIFCTRTFNPKKISFL